MARHLLAPLSLWIAFIVSCEPSGALKETDDHREVQDTSLVDDRDGDGLPVEIDCDDEDAQVGLPARAWPDLDGDGHGNPSTKGFYCDTPSGWAAIGDDCDDTDPQVYPGAPEPAGGGVDANCDGLFSCFEDRDGDGEGSAVTVASQERECTLGGESSSDRDCDDEDPEVHSDAVERCNGWDDDCDGLIDDADLVIEAELWYLDWDEDGFGVTEAIERACLAPMGFVSSPGDCDDHDPEVNPGESERCDDGIDNNCDGTAAPCGLYGESGLADSGAKVFGSSPLDEAGSSVANADLNGDGREDLLMGAPYAAAYAGRAYVVLGPILGELEVGLAEVTFLGEDSSWAGYSVAATELNGDGVADVLIGAPTESSAGEDAGALYLLNGPFIGSRELNSADAILLGEADSTTSGSHAGLSVASGDFDGDGLADVVVGAEGESSAGEGSGAAYVLFSPFWGTQSLALADLEFTGEEAGDRAGNAVGAADLDGDGLAELFVGAWSYSEGLPLQGAVYILRSPVDASMGLASADVRMPGESTFDCAGVAFAAGDVDGDGNEDLIVGAQGESTNGAFAGAAYILTGPPGDLYGLSLATAKLLGEASENYAGGALAAEDMDDDGFADVLVGASGESSAGASAGAVYLVRGPLSGSLELGAAETRLRGEDEDDHAGTALSIGDLGDSSHLDLLVGARGEDSGGSYAGAVYLLFGGGAL